jgi:hypothetical protein
MSTVFGVARRLALTPSFADVSFAGLKFPVTASAATRRLEAIPQAVICGFEWGIEVPGLDELVQRLELVDPLQRGFAYEGATMAYTVRDAMAAGRGGRTARLLSGPGVPHTFLTYIGIGFAMARLPRPLWRNVLPDLTGTPYFPTMSWLAVDGYGFDRAYFDPTKYVTGQQRPTTYPWQGRADYFPRAVDQGVGRALWFIHGGAPDAVGAAVRRFATTRHADLWSGVGLAATFAGGADAAGLTTLVRESGELHSHLGQGSVFAAKARQFSGHVPPHSAEAVHVLTGLALPAAAALADDVSLSDQDGDGAPDYEIWRRQVRDRIPAGAMSAR